VNEENYTQAEENYLKAVFKISGKHKRRVSTNDLAHELRTKASSVTDMLQKLADKKLITYEKYKGVSLTEKGRVVAASVIRKHRLWEVFLVDKLQFKWDEIHELAEQLEHIHSAKLVERLDEFLGFPTHDPHGDPIPDTEGNLHHHPEFSLSDLNINEEGIIIGVKDHSADFLQYLDSVKLILGTRVKIKKRFGYDNSLIALVNKQETMISERVAKNLFVVKKA
jgi:DtxR family Mn-dependent transcriptional regulator